MFRIRLGILGVMALAMLAACSAIKPPRPRERDLTGTYRLTAASVRFLQRSKHYGPVPASTIEIHADSTLVLRQLPDCAADPAGDGQGRFVDGRARWRIVQVDLGYALELQLEAGASGPARTIGGSWLLVRRRSPPYELMVVVGDPDANQAIFYRRS